MNFPYPLTPEVRRDLWEYFGSPDADTMVPGVPALPGEAWVRAGGRDSAGPIALADTPFTRAFVAWREERATPRPTVKRFQCAQCGRPVTVGAYHYCEGGAHIGPDPVTVSATRNSLNRSVE